jgi:hypothetical protein
MTEGYWVIGGDCQRRVCRPGKCQGSEDMSREFRSELAKRVSGDKKHSRIWALFALCAAVLVCGAVAVNAAMAGNGDMVQDRQQGGTCDNGDCDRDCDGVCDNDADGDGICDNKEDGTCQD